MKYRKKPVVIDATAWFQNGDHPQDNSYPINGSGEPFLSEGKTVRRYRTPEMDGQTPCRQCGHIMHNHGWIDTLEGGHIVCPGDYIITGIKGEMYPCKPDIFAATYEAIALDADIYEQADAFRAAVAAYEQTQADALTARYAIVLETLKPQLDRLTAQIADARANGEAVNYAWLLRQARYKALIQQTEVEIGRFARAAERTIAAGQAGAVDLAQTHTQTLIEAGQEGQETPRINASFNRLPTNAFENIVGYLGDGSPLKTLLDQLPKQGGKSVGDALAKGVALGWNPRKTAKEVAATAGISGERALVISRTETLRAYRQAAIQSYQANADVVNGWRWVAALSGRSCAMCIAMHGSIHPVTDQFHSHVCCRCTPIPVVIGTENDAFETGAEWFEKQRQKTQDTILGSVIAGAAYRAGQVSLADFVGEKKDYKWGLTRFATSLKTAQKSRGITIISNVTGIVLNAKWFSDMEQVVSSVHALPPYPILYRPSVAKTYTGIYESGETDIIRVSRYSGSPHLSFAHETGHRVERRGLTSPDALFLATEDDPILNEWRQAVMKSNVMRQELPYFFKRRSEADRELARYLAQPEELWARSYAQYIAVKSQHPEMLAELRQIQQGVMDGNLLPFYWQDADFVLLFDTIDRLFKAKRWIP